MLERIEIENLGAIQKTAISLGPLTVLIGSNGSGKTTVMRGIELFSALREQPLTKVTFAGHPLTEKSWPLILHGGDPARRLIFRGFLDRGSIEPDYEIQLGIDWTRVSESIAQQAESPQPEPEILMESLRDPREPEGGRLIVKGHGSPSIEIPPNIRMEFSPPVRVSMALVVKRLSENPGLRRSYEPLIQFVESLGTARYFRPSSAAMLYAVPDDRVSPLGEGFVAALAALQNRESERFDTIEKHLKSLFPHILRVRFDVSGAVRHLVFETTRSTRLTPAEFEADGVMTTLFLLWAGTTTPPHGTLLIDEPEAALHPHLMGRRIEFLRRLANGDFTGHRLQVVAATQSVDFVRWLDTSEIRVVEYSPDTGALVHAIPESETLRTLIEKFHANAGELWFSGALGGIPGTGA